MLNKFYSSKDLKQFARLRTELDTSYPEYSIYRLDTRQREREREKEIARLLKIERAIEIEWEKERDKNVIYSYEGKWKVYFDSQYIF